MDSVRERRLNILGVPMDLIGQRQACSLLYQSLQSTSGPMFHVTTLNPEYVIAARKSQTFGAAIAQSELIVCDGIGTLLAAKFLHRSEAANLERVTGVELASLLAEWSAFQNEPGLFLLGGEDAGAAAAGLQRSFPATRVAGAWSGGAASSRWDSDSIERIKRSGATVLLVAYGAPDQVLWIERNRQQLTEAGVRIAIGVGGSLDYFSGHAAAAPEIARRFGLEWLVRLWREPWRWRRQLALPVFAALVLKEGTRRRLLSWRG